ncbi:MAG: histidine kinase [Sandaracinaceae bacterium]|nr:histidine kinase [Sandaracinaceae bacterium]
MIDALAPLRSSFGETIPPPAPEEPLLPRRAMWFFVVGPAVLAFLFDPHCLKEPGHMTRAMIAIEAFTVITGLGVHYGVEWLHRALRGRPWVARAVAGIVFVPAVVAVVGVPQLPLVMWVYPEAAGEEISILSRSVLIAFAYLALAGFIGRLQRRAVRERLRAHEERTFALESRLAALQSQMQPHFLFNSLNVCAGLVHTDPDLAEETVDRLAGFLRYALESSERRLVPLDEELDAITSYLEVQRQRFGERLRFAVSSDAHGWSVPPMLLQPLVENAVLHGIGGLERGGSVRVDARERGDSLVVVVEDDGVGPGASTHAGTGLGQRNVRERLRLMYGTRAHLGTGRTERGGYRCELVLPAGR